MNQGFQNEYQHGATVRNKNALSPQFREADRNRRKEVSNKQFQTMLKPQSVTQRDQENSKNALKSIKREKLRNEFKKDYERAVAQSTNQQFVNSSDVWVEFNPVRHNDKMVRNEQKSREKTQRVASPR